MADDSQGFPKLDIKAARALRPNIHEAQIESIFGGEATYANFGRTDQYQAGQGILPDSSLGASSGQYMPSGYIIPSFVSSIGTFGVTYPLWIKTTPKDVNYYVYCANGSVFTTNGGSSVTGLADLNDGGDAAGNGFEYYDNYVYAARATTVARYGPLDGAPAWTDDYWVATLGKTALANTTYPYPANFGVLNLNHVMLRHTDGALYFADVVGNQGVLHKISTTKTTVEGDTDNGSTYNAIDFPYGMWPTALASYGDKIAVALVEQTTGAGQGGGETPAKIAIWDPTNPTTYDLITGSELSDPYISALLNANGMLYVFSGAFGSATGLRVLRYLGGRSFEQVAYIDHAYLPYPGAVSSYLNRINICGSASRTGSQRAAIFSIGSKVSGVTNVIANAICAPGSMVFCAAQKTSGFGLSQQAFVFGGWDDTNNTSRMFRQAAPVDIGLAQTNSYFISNTFRIGRKFKVTKITFNLTGSIGASDTYSVTPYVLVDEKTTSYAQNTISYATVADKKHIVVKPINAVGDNNFNLQLDFNGQRNTSYGQGISLPITIEYEILDD